MRAQGFKSLINNRPDGEAERQPTSASLAEAAARLGIAYRHLPVISGKVTDGDVASFSAALDELEGPVLAFCRTGTRSTTLWALSEARHRDPDAILKTAAAAGYNLESLRPRLEVRSRTGRLVDRRRQPAGPQCACGTTWSSSGVGPPAFRRRRACCAAAAGCRWPSSSRARRIIISRDGPWSAPASSAEPRPSDR